MWKGLKNNGGSARFVGAAKLCAYFYARLLMCNKILESVPHRLVKNSIKWWGKMHIYVLKIVQLTPFLGARRAQHITWIIYLFRATTTTDTSVPTKTFSDLSHRRRRLPLNCEFAQWMLAWLTELSQMKICHHYHFIAGSQVWCWNQFMFQLEAPFAIFDPFYSVPFIWNDCMLVVNSITCLRIASRE